LVKETFPSEKIVRPGIINMKGKDDRFGTLNPNLWLYPSKTNKGN